MSQLYPSPSSLRLELEARRLHAAAGAAGVDEMAAPLVLARCPAFFDLFACGFAAFLAFPQVFFPGLRGEAALLAGLAIALLPLAISPLGALAGRTVGRRFGRGVGLTAGQFILGASTTGVAFLPSHAQAGQWAAVLLVGCRLVQGLSAGAAWGDEPSRSARSGRIAGSSLIAASATLGLLIAGGLMMILDRSLAHVDFTAWGWRYPFAIGFAVNIVALFANLRLLAIPTTQSALG